MDATYINATTFSVEEDKTDEFLINRRLKLDCDGYKYASVVSSSFTTVTTVTIDESVLTVDLVEVFYSVIKPGLDGNLSDHFHTTIEGDGGYIEPGKTTFIDLNDTPITFSGEQGKYLKVNDDENAIEFMTINGGSGAQTFLDLSDTPSTFSGDEDNYLVVNSTGSGIRFKGPTILYGTGDPPDASGYEDGTVYFKYNN